MRILLTGGSGTVGKRVLEKLCECDTFNIIAFDVKNKRTQSFYRPYQNQIKIKYGDLSKKEEIEPICKNIDFVIHLAAIIPPLADKKPNLAQQVNVIGTQNLIRSLEIHSKNAFFLYASSVSVYGDRLENPQIRTNDPLIPSKGDEYAKTKIEAELLVTQSKLDWSIFRLSAIMGTGNHKATGLMFHMPLATSLEITTPQDAARAFVNALNKKELLSKKVFNLGGGEKCRTTYQDFLSKSFSILGLGQLDFPEYSFAEKNFHCGFYADGDQLDNILKFREDTIDAYFVELENSISPIKKSATYLLKKQIKKYLLTLSEPYNAYKKKNTPQLQHYFNVL